MVKPAKPTPPSPDEQVDHVVRLMATGQWRGMTTRAELAQQWGCHPRTVGDRAVIASALLKRTGGDLEAWVEGKLAELDQLKAEALMLEKPDVKAAIQAIRTQLEIRGAIGPAKRAAASDVPAEYQELTPQQRIEAHRAAIAEEEQRMGERH